MHAGRIYCQSAEKGVNNTTVSIITMRSRLFPANSVSDCLRFAKSRPQLSESCGAIYRRICETFSSLQSTFGPVTDFETMSKSMHNWQRYPSWNWYEVDDIEKNRNISAQLQFILYTTAQKRFLENLLPAGLLVRTNLM